MFVNCKDKDTGKHAHSIIDDFDPGPGIKFPCPSILEGELGGLGESIGKGRYIVSFVKSLKITEAKFLKSEL